MSKWIRLNDGTLLNLDRCLQLELRLRDKEFWINFYVEDGDPATRFTSEHFSSRAKAEQRMDELAMLLCDSPRRVRRSRP